MNDRADNSAMTEKGKAVTPRKVTDGERVAVLVSPGFGAGWSSWAHEYAEFLLFDKSLVEMAQRKASTEEVEAHLKRVLNDEYVYCGGWDQIKVEWVDNGTAFRIDEYDGSERLIVLALEEHFIA